VTNRDAPDALGALFVAASSTLFGGVVIVGKVVTARGLPVASLLWVRFAVVALLLAAIVVGIGQSLRAAPGEGWRLVALGSAGYAVEAGFFFLALGRGSASAVTLLFFTYPVWVALFSAMAGRGLPGRLVGGSLVAAVAGAALVVASSGGLDITPAGVVFALASAVTFALYILGADLAVRRTSSLASAMWVGGSAAVATGMVAAVMGSRLPRGGPEWWGVVGMGALTAAAFVLLFLGLRRVGAVRTSIIAAMEPVTTALMAAVLLGERLRPGVIGGGALILAAAITASVARRRAAVESAGP
jgi:drug/metabolite transporter (DMT)-like permease